MATHDDERKPRQFEHPTKSRPGHDRWQTTRRHAPEDREERSSSGGIGPVSTFEGQAAQYLVLIEGGPPSNYSAWSPDLPGCAATGATIEECEREMREAIAFHLEGLAEDGAPLPPPSGGGVYVEHPPRAAA